MLGCSGGDLTRAVPESAGVVVGVGDDRESLKLGAREAEESGQGYVRSVLARGDSLPFRSGSFECVLVPRAEGCAELQEASRVLVAGGRVAWVGERRVSTDALQAMGLETVQEGLDVEFHQGNTVQLARRAR